MNSHQTDFWKVKMTAKNIVVDKTGCIGWYTVCVVPEGKDEPVNKNKDFILREIDGHHVIEGPHTPFDTDCDIRTPYCVEHDGSKARERLIKEIRRFVSKLYEHYDGGIEEVVDKTGEDILKGWKPPVLFPSGW